MPASEIHAIQTCHVHSSLQVLAQAGSSVLVAFPSFPSLLGSYLVVFGGPRSSITPSVKLALFLQQS